jgi:hypothetical protein
MKLQNDSPDKSTLIIITTIVTTMSITIRTTFLCSPYKYSCGKEQVLSSSATKDKGFAHTIELPEVLISSHL